MNQKNSGLTLPRAASHRPNSKPQSRWGSVKTGREDAGVHDGCQNVCPRTQSRKSCGLRGLGIGLGWKGNNGTRMDVPDGSNLRKQVGTISLNLHPTDMSKGLRELSVYRLSLRGFLRGHQA